MIENLKSRTICSDAGRAVSGINERNDCTIRALSIAAGISYKMAHQIGQEAGRTSGKGFYPEDLLAFARKKYKIANKKMRFKRMTIQKFLKRYPEGRYYVATNNHAFAIINGNIYDTGLNRPMQRLEEGYLMSNHRLTLMKETQSF